MDPIDQVLLDNRRIARVRELAQERPEIALPELGPLLTVATSDPVLAEVLLAVRPFGAQAVELLPAIEKLADSHPDSGVRTLAKSTVKRIRAAPKATEDSS